MKTAEAKRKIARYAALHDTNIAQRIEIIIEHFRTTIMGELGGTAKAMVVTGSRQEAVKYKQAFDKYIRQKSYSMKAIVAFSGKVKMQGTDYTEAGMNGFSEQKTRDKFDSSEYHVMIVANKYQTGFDLKGKITASDFKQEKTGMYVKEDIVPYPIVKLPVPDNINISPEVYQKLSDIIDEINSRTGQNFDRDVAVKSMLQLRDIMLKSDDLKASARNNTASNFEISFYNQLDDILVEGYEQNQDFFSLLLSNEGIKHQAMGIFADEVYRELRENQMNV